MNVEDLIIEMQEVKAAHSTLSIDQVLQIFNIQALINLSSQISRMLK